MKKVNLLNEIYNKLTAKGFYNVTQRLISKILRKRKGKISQGLFAKSTLGRLQYRMAKKIAEI